MNQKLYPGALLALALLSPGFAHSAADMYVSASLHSFSHDETTLIVDTDTTDTTFVSDGDDSDAYSLAWGAAEVNARFAFEYYYQTAEMSGFQADYTKQTLLYSGYWTPNLFVPKLHGILGAGVGGSELDLDSDDPAIGRGFKDREVQYKITIGVEYRILDSLVVFGGFERHYNSKYTDWTSSDSQLTLKDSDYGGFMLGIAGRF